MSLATITIDVHLSDHLNQLSTKDMIGLINYHPYSQDIIAKVIEENSDTLTDLPFNDLVDQVRKLNLENSTKLLILLHGMIAGKVGVRPC